MAGCRRNFVNYSTLKVGRPKETFSRFLKIGRYHKGRICHMKPGRPFESNKNEIRGPRITPAPPLNPPEKGPIPEKGRKRRMDSIGVQGNVTGAIAVGASITFYPNVRSNRNRRPPLQYGVRPRTRDRPFPPFRWNTPRLNKNRRNIPLPPL